LSFTVVVPARLGSTRLPEKVLADIGGRPMLAHVHDRARESGAARVVVATDSEAVAGACAGFGAEALRTAAGHPSGTDRIAEAVARLGLGPDAVVVNLQGDEPLMPPELLGQVAGDLEAHGDAAIATLCVPLAGARELADPNVVKVVRDRAGYALYFSRAPVPWSRDAGAGGAPEPGLHARHLGLYAYRAGYLARYAALGPCPLEQRERLEQLRALWAGERIHVADARAAPPPGVDTAADLERVRRQLT
jgi:3-deoxy-manno-octulosonate cytidylyltransferase (CMP-KDO synthetase)